MPKPTLIRVKDPVSGAEYDVPESRLKVCPDLEVVEKPTGQRTKPRLPLGDPLPGGASDRKRSKQNNEPTVADQPQADENDGQSVTITEEN